MKWTTGPVVVLSLLMVSACGGEVRGTSQSTAATASAQGVRPIHFRSINLPSGTWATHALTPSSNLVLTQQSGLVGRRVEDLNHVQFGTIDYLLVDRNTAAAEYAVVRDDRAPDTYIAVPLDAMVITDKVAQTDSPLGEMNVVPKYTLSGLQQRFAAGTVNTPVVVATPLQPLIVTGVPAGTAVVAAPTVVPASAAMSREAVYLNQRNEWVGRSVVDATGAPIGTVDYVAVSPTNGDPRYVVMSGPMFGPGYSVFVPYAQTRFSGGRVVVDTPMATLMQSERFRTTELSQLYVVN